MGLFKSEKREVAGQLANSAEAIRTSGDKQATLRGMGITDIPAGKEDAFADELERSAGKRPHRWGRKD